MSVWRYETEDIQGVRYVTGCRLVREIGAPELPDEAVAPCPFDLTDAAGHLQWALVPDRDGMLVLERRAQPDTPAEITERATQEKRSRVLAALPDILLAVADGKDLKSEIEKVLSAMPVEEVGNDRSSG